MNNGMIVHVESDMTHDQLNLYDGSAWDPGLNAPVAFVTREQRPRNNYLQNGFTI